MSLFLHSHPVSTIPSLNTTSFTRYFTDMSKSLAHCPYRNVGPQRLAPSALTNLAKHFAKVLKRNTEVLKILNDLNVSILYFTKKYKIETTSLRLWPTAPLLVIRSSCNYKTAGSNTLVCLFSALFLMVVPFWFAKAAIYILAYLRLMAIAVRIHTTNLLRDHHVQLWTRRTVLSFSNTFCTAQSSQKWKWEKIEKIPCFFPV